MNHLFFDDWETLLRTFIMGVCAYACLVVFLRVSGNRTLAKMNAFDLVVTVALGSTLASILLSKQVVLAQGALAFLLLIGLQFLITWSSVRAPWIRRLVTGEPSLLVHQGRCLPAAMKKARVSREEVLSAIRAQGLPRLENARAVVLETDGSFSVVEDCERPATSLDGVEIPADGSGKL